MDKTLVCLVSAVGALAAAGPASAAVSAAPLADAMRATSYADLLKPIPNAVALMKQAVADDAERDAATLATEPQATVQDVQVIILPNHHHHHHRYYRRHRHYHYHHHHHHQS